MIRENKVYISFLVLILEKGAGFIIKCKGLHGHF